MHNVFDIDIELAEYVWDFLDENYEDIDSGELEGITLVFDASEREYWIENGIHEDGDRIWFGLDCHERCGKAVYFMYIYEAITRVLMEVEYESQRNRETAR